MLLQDLYLLTKPGIIRGNLIAATAGFFLAAKGVIDWQLLAAALGGTALVIAAGCVFNNYLDRSIDQKMERTKDRALVNGRISVSMALTYGALLAVAGFGLLIAEVNWLTAAIGFIALVFYVIVYGYFKRRSTLGTVVGSIPGALPPVAGYTAVSGQLDAAAGLLFLSMALWQMPHFYAIAIYRSREYISANVPVLPAVKSVKLTQQYILLYIVAYIGITALFSTLNYTGLVFILLVAGLGGYWLWYGYKGLGADDTDKWAKGMFGISLLVMLAVSIGLIANAWLP